MLYRIGNNYIETNNEKELFLKNTANNYNDFKNVCDHGVVGINLIPKLDIHNEIKYVSMDNPEHFFLNRLKIVAKELGLDPPYFDNRSLFHLVLDISKDDEAKTFIQISQIDSNTYIIDLTIIEGQKLSFENLSFIEETDKFIQEINDKLEYLGSPIKF